MHTILKGIAPEVKQFTLSLPESVKTVTYSDEYTVKCVQCRYCIYCSFSSIQCAYNATGTDQCTRSCYYRKLITLWCRKWKTFYNESTWKLTNIYLKNIQSFWHKKQHCLIWACLHFNPHDASNIRYYSSLLAWQ